MTKRTDLTYQEVKSLLIALSGRLTDVDERISSSEDGIEKNNLIKEYSNIEDLYERLSQLRKSF